MCAKLLLLFFLLTFHPNNAESENSTASTSSSWYPKSSSWYPKSSSWYPSSTSWYPRSSSWYPRSSTRYTTSAPTSAPSTIYCNNHRDISAKEFPTNGDLTCEEQVYSVINDLLVRETIVQIPTSSRSYSYTRNYHKLIMGHVRKVNILNFGEAHGFVQRIVIKNLERVATIDAQIEVPPQEEIKLFVEIYGREVE